LDLARRRELEALFDAALGLELGHFLSFAPLWSELSTGHGGPFGRAVLIVPEVWKGRAYKGGRPITQDRGVPAREKGFSRKGAKPRRGTLRTSSRLSAFA